MDKTNLLLAQTRGTTDVSNVHRHVEKLLTGFLQAGGRGVVLDAVVLEVIEPSLYRGGGYVVKFVDANDVVFGEYVLRD